MGSIRSGCGEAIPSCSKEGRYPGLGFAVCEVCEASVRDAFDDPRPLDAMPSSISGFASNFEAAIGQSSSAMAEASSTPGRSLREMGCSDSDDILLKSSLGDCVSSSEEILGDGKAAIGVEYSVPEP